MYLFSTKLKLAVSYIVVCMLTAAALPVSAQKPLRVDVIPVNQEFKDLVLELSLYELDGDQKKYGRKGSGAKLLAKGTSRDADGASDFSVPIGTKLVMCVYSSQAGVLTLWSRMDDKSPVQLYPNKYTPSIKGGGPVGADEEVCVGHTDNFRLVVSGQAGQLDRVYTHWTPDANSQLAQSHFPVIGKANRQLKNASSYGAASVQFRLAN